MELLQSLYLTQMMHTISSAMTVPVVVALLLFIVYAIYTIGSLVVEAAVERRRYCAKVPALVAQLEECDPAKIEDVIAKSGLLVNQQDDLRELASYLYLPEDGRTEVAKRLLANERAAFKKTVSISDALSKIAPMVGLMGTLIPLGPGLVALGAGEVSTLSSAMQFAFDTTVAGLLAAIVFFVATKLRRSWYSDYLVSMEACFNALLEKGELMHQSGYVFDRAVWRYDKSGRHAVSEALDEPAGNAATASAGSAPAGEAE